MRWRAAGGRWDARSASPTARCGHATASIARCGRTCGPRPSSTRPKVATLSLDRTTEPRIEPEVVFGLRGPVLRRTMRDAVLDAVDWIAPGFGDRAIAVPRMEILSADRTAAFGLHRALVRARADPGRRIGTVAGRAPGVRARAAARGDVIERGRGRERARQPCARARTPARTLFDGHTMPGLAPGRSSPRAP